MASRKENIGYTSSFKQEVCRWKGSTPCPRHKTHNVLSVDLEKFHDIPVFENPDEPASEFSLTHYLRITQEIDEDRSLDTVEDLTPYEKHMTEMMGRVEIDNAWYKPDADGNLNEIRIVETQDDLTDIELEELQDNGFINIDGIGYYYDDYGYLIMSESSHGQTLNLEDRHVQNIDQSFKDYVENNENKNQTLDLEVEQWFMTGGCGVYALAFQELNPSYNIAVDKYWCEGEPVFNHVFCVDPASGKAYDSRGEFESVDALLDYKSDPHSGVISDDSDWFEDDGYAMWSKEFAEHMVSVGTFLYVDNEKDISYIKRLITGFNKRYN